MTAYVDSSAVLRVMLQQPGALAQWGSITRGVSSTLLRVECLRAIERLRTRGILADREVAIRRDAVLDLLATYDLVHPDPIVLERAAWPMPTELGTLDAIHLATAQLWQELRGESLVMATHDRSLGTAAQAFGFEVLGLS